MYRYAKPTSLNDALALLGDGDWTILAGGTDFYPALGSKPLRQDVLDINGLEELRGISATDSHILIGARTTWTDILRAELPSAFDGLKQAAREVGSVQIQNCGTVAGNLCNASPAADGAPPLLTLDAEVELQSARGPRVLPLSEFILGNRKTVLARDELLTGIRVPTAATKGASAFLKLGARRYLVISIAMVAARLVADAEGKILSAAVAVGSCSAVAQRLVEVEQSLTGLPLGQALAEAAMTAKLDELSPIDDVRGSADYRGEAARELVARALLAASGEAGCLSRQKPLGIQRTAS
ncbi:MAG: xanthine dehydrogenase family protein subunit M [Rhizobiaceae bacterium]